MAVRVDTVVEEPRDAGGAALYELHEALLAVFRELDDLIQLLGRLCFGWHCRRWGRLR